MKANIFGKKIAFYIAIIIVWQAVDSADIWPDNIFPSPIEVEAKIRLLIDLKNLEENLIAIEIDINSKSETIII